MAERNYQKYTEEFKLEALVLLKQGQKKASQIEREMGITPGLLLKWRTRYQAVEKRNGEVHLEPSDLEAAKTEIHWLQQKLAQVEEERETLHLPWRAVPGKKSSQHFSPQRQMKFIAAHESEHDVKPMCWILGVSRSGYYAWRRRPKTRESRRLRSCWCGSGKNTSGRLGDRA